MKVEVSRLPSPILTSDGVVRIHGMERGHRADGSERPSLPSLACGEGGLPVPMYVRGVMGLVLRDRFVEIEEDAGDGNGGG